MESHTCWEIVSSILVPVFLPLPSTYIMYRQMLLDSKFNFWAGQFLPEARDIEGKSETSRCQPVMFGLGTCDKLLPKLFKWI